MKRKHIRPPLRHHKGPHHRGAHHSTQAPGRASGPRPDHSFKHALAQQPYGLHVPFDRGYDADSQRHNGVAEDNSPSGRFLAPNGDQISLWLHNITADFSLSGSVGQSRMKRDFYPHSFNDVTLKLTGQTSSNSQYNRLAAFVRKHHWTALQAINSGNSADQTIRFELFNTYGNNQVPGDGIYRDSEVKPGTKAANVKGSHRPWVVNGYIRAIQAGATANIVAEEFNIEFIVTTSTLNGSTGIWEDDAVVGNVLYDLMTDLTLLNGGSLKSQGSGFTQNPNPFISEPIGSYSAVTITAEKQKATEKNNAAKIKNQLIPHDNSTSGAVAKTKFAK